MLTKANDEFDIEHNSRLQQKRESFRKALEYSLNKVSVTGKDGRSYKLIVPFDHIVSDGMMPGVATVGEVKSLVDQLAANGATAILSHVGVINGIRKIYNDKVPISTIVHVSGQTAAGAKNALNDPYRKTLVTSVEEAILAGAHVVSVHINISSRDEPEQFADFMKVKQQRLECFEKYGVVPGLLIMAYPREGFKDEYDIEAIKGAVAAAGGLGADIIKTNFHAADPHRFKEVIDGATAPVIIAGGPKIKPDGTEVNPIDVLKWCEDAKNAGGSGISLGRNIFQQKPYDKGPGIMIKSIYNIFVEGMNAEEAAEESGLVKLLKK